VKSGWRFPNDFFCCRQGRNALLAAFTSFTRQQQLLGFGGVTVHQPVGTHTTSATEINGYFRPVQEEEEEEELRHVPHSPNSQMVRRRFSVWRVFRHTIDGKLTFRKRE
jgi:hypothetical protein